MELEDFQDSRISKAAAEMLKAGVEQCLDKFAAAELKHHWKDKFLTAKEDEIQAAFREHVAKGDPRDVVVYCFIMLWHGWKIK
jgi:hypothetical protein